VDGAAVVLGDLTLDVTWTSGEPWPASKKLGADVTIVATPEYHIGGTGFLFAKAVGDMTSLEPVIVSAVGDDPIGEAVRQELRGGGYRIDGIQTAEAHPTCLVTSSYLVDGTRLMVRPSTHAGKHIGAEQLSALLGSIDDCALVFISGYMLAGPGASTRAALRLMSAWAFSRAIPVVVDLVPHEFMESVGPISVVEQMLGNPVTVYIAELRTIQGLGLVAEEDQTLPLPDRLGAAAEALARYSPVAIAQCQVGRTTYGQSCVARGRPAAYTEHDFDERTRLGLGDRLATGEITRSALELRDYAKHSEANDRNRSTSTR
jgi:sugar/nucleoside kinase (ribokinase family)